MFPIEYFPLQTHKLLPLMADKKANCAHYLRKTEVHVFINQVQSMNEGSSFGGKQLN